MKLFAEHSPLTQRRDTVFASDNFEDLTLLPIPPVKPLGARVVLLTYKEYTVLNPPDAPGSYMPGSDSQLYRDDPRTVSEVFTNWTEYEAPEEKTQFELNCEEFIQQLDEYRRAYDALRTMGDTDGAAQLKKDLLILIDSAQASGQTGTDPQLRQTVACIRYALAA